MSMKIIYDNIDFFMSINLSNWLSARNKIIDNVTEAIVLAKTDSTDEDIDAVFTADLNSGITKSSDFLLVESDATDFGTGKLEVSGVYNLYLGIKFAGDPKYREVVLEDDELEVKQDGIRG